MVSVIVSNIYSKIVGFLPEKVQDELEDVLRFKVPNAKYSKKFKSGKWDGWIRLYRRNGQSFYTGLLSFIREILKKHTVEFSIEDRRICPEQNFPELKFSAPSFFEERDYQTYTIQKAYKYTRGILSVCTAGGKTMMVSRLIGEIKTYPFVFYVLTRDLMQQAYEVLSSTLNCPIGRIGDGLVDIQKINICTIQTAIKALHPDDKNFKISDYLFDEEDEWDENGIENAEKAEQVRLLIRGAKGVYLDECHHVSSKTAKEVMIASENAYWRYGGSATPYRDDNSDLLIQAMFGAKIVDISASYLIQKGYLVPPYIFIVPIDSDKDFHSWKKVYKNSVVENQEFHRHVADVAKHLMSKDLTVLILVKEIPHGKYLKSLISNSEFVTGKQSTEIRKEALDSLRNKTLKALIATSLADEGIDLPSLDVVIIAGGGASSTRINQRIGRSIRKSKANPNKTRSIVIIYDHYKTRYLKDHTKKLKRIIKREKEFQIVYPKDKDFVKDEIDVVLGIKNKIGDVFSV